MAVVAGAALTPSAAAVEADQPPAGATTTATGTDSGELRLDRAQAQLAREHVEGVLEKQLGGMSVEGGQNRAQAATVSPTVDRRYGTDRYATAAALADAWWGDRFWNPKSGPVNFEKVVVVASGHTYADALSGGAAAAAWGGPLLLTRRDNLPGATKSVLNRLQPDAIIVLGGTSAVSAAVEEELRDFAQVTRVDGKDRWTVSARLAAGIGYSETAFVASGVSFPDGLAGGAAAGQVMAPLLITKADGVPGPVLNVLKTEVFPDTVYVLGGPAAVNESVLTQLRTALPGVTVRRVGGDDRYKVAAAVANLYPTTYGGTVAFGGDFPDALAGSALAGLIGNKLLLVREGNIPGATASSIQAHKLLQIDLLGGPNVVNDDVLRGLRKISFPTP